MTYPQLLEAYRAKHGKLVEPRQGWDSLHASLHLAYSMGIARSFYDVGTYAAKPGDHGMWPARAFDLRRKGWVGRFGYGWVAAQLLARHYWKHHVALNLDYVIVGRKIISRRHPTWRPYTRDSSHDWHLHVSGWWPAKDL